MKGSYEEAYLPVAVEIGLFMHRKKGELLRDSVLQDYKWCCVHRLIRRHHLLQEPARTPALLRRCLDALKSLEPCIRASYPREQDQVGIRQDVLISMLIDGCFILHGLLTYERIARREATNPTAGIDVNEEEDDDDWTQEFGRCYVWSSERYDLLLLENQIPFFVVQKLFEQLRTDPNETCDVLIAGALRLFRSVEPQNLHSPIACRVVHHLLHLFYISVGLLAAAPDEPHQHMVPLSELPQWVPCTRELEEAGVSFRTRKGTMSFLDVRFHDGVLEISELQLYDYSEPLFRNLIAFEQTYPFTPGHVTAYAMFMDCLVTSPKDKRLLHLSGVLVNHMNGKRGKRDTPRFFGRLCAEAYLADDRNYLAGVIRQVNRYQTSRWRRWLSRWRSRWWSRRRRWWSMRRKWRSRLRRWRAALMRKYFSTPWSVMSLVTAAFLLALTFMQTYFAAYSYFKPPKQQ